MKRGLAHETASGRLIQRFTDWASDRILVSRQRVHKDARRQVHIPTEITVRLQDFSLNSIK